jgi:hypothetical protein
MAVAGEFDAFNTIMAILRTRASHPKLDPRRYYDDVPAFRDFIDCKPCE